VKILYRNDALVVRDEGAADGVFVRIKGTVGIVPGDRFMAGDQVLRFDVDLFDHASGTQEPAFRVTQILAGSSTGIMARARGSSLRVGREMGDMNIPDDPHLSTTHCMLEKRGETYVLTDLNSRNGTYVRVKAERELAHRDYLFIGKKLLRVEIATE
jgi:hypothetical protein